MASTMAMGRKIGKLSVGCGNCDGFLANRSRAPFNAEMVIMLEEGALPEQIDKVMVDFGYPMGPFAVGDLAGLDIGAESRKRRAAADPNYRKLPIADRLVEMGRFGQKTGAGWYRYEKGDRTPHPDPIVKQIIADVGNNLGRRGQLMLHFLPEPKPGTAAVRPTRTLQVHYEDQKEATPDYDCEAVFCINDRIFFLTKHHDDQLTILYRLDGESTRKSNPLRRVGSFDIGGMVTAADASPDGKLVAVLTYTAVWIFDYDAKVGNIFGRSVRRLPIFAWQAEALAFDGNTSLVIANESGQMFRVAVSDFQSVK
jgi:hypothetical protein